MKSLSTIKLEIKDIQDNFNPAKSTYKTLEDIVNNDHSIEDIVYMISKIHGMNRYPDDIKNKFSDIVSDLKELREEEIKYKERKNMELEKQMQEASTKELKDIINLLEKEMKKEGKQAKEEIAATKEEEFLDEEESKEEIKEKIVFNRTKLLVWIIIITLIILLLLFLFY